MTPVIKELNPLKMMMYGALIWIVRVALLIPFLQDGRLPISAEEVEAKGGRLPESAEFFFSTLIFAFTIATLFGCYQLFKGSGKGNYLTKGIVIALFFLVTVTAIDLPISSFVAGRTLSQFFINVALDYSPLILIPIFMGLTLQAATNQ